MQRIGRRRNRAQVQDSSRMKPESPQKLKKDTLKSINILIIWPKKIRDFLRSRLKFTRYRKSKTLIYYIRVRAIKLKTVLL